MKWMLPLRMVGAFKQQQTKLGSSHLLYRIHRSYPIKSLYFVKEESVPFSDSVVDVVIGQTGMYHVKDCLLGTMTSKETLVTAK